MFTDGHSPFPMRKTSTSSEATPPPQPPPVTIPEEQQVPNAAAVATGVSQEESQGGKVNKVLVHQLQDGSAQQSSGERDREQPPSLENGGQAQLTNTQQDSKQGTYQEQLNGDTTVPSASDSHEQAPHKQDGQLSSDSGF